MALAMVFCVFAVGTAGFRVLSPPQGVTPSGHPIPVSWLDSLYMTVISLTTVGFGEALPIRGYPYMMVFTSLLLLCGIGVITYTFSLVTAFIVEQSVSEVIWRRRMKKRIDQLGNHYVVCGAGGTGLAAIQELHETGNDCVVIDANREILDKVAEEYDVCILVGDATDEEVLQRAGIERAAGVLANLASDQDNLFLVMTARQLNEKARIAAKVMNPKNSRKFYKVGATALASPQTIGGLRLASELLRPSVVSFLDLMLRDTDRTLRVEEVNVPVDSEFEGKSLKDLNFRNRFDLQVLAMRRPGESKFEYNPNPVEPLTGGTILIVQGDVARVRELREQLNA